MASGPFWPTDSSSACQLAETSGRTLPPLDDVVVSDRACPRCRATLKEATLGPVRADHCLTCQGVYLDGGGLHGLRTGAVHRSATVALRAAKQPPASLDRVADGVAGMLKLLVALP
ncbi:MAG: zf-TFIIB domain-containing protein [Planctomycetota bacterium]